MASTAGKKRANKEFHWWSRLPVAFVFPHGTPAPASHLSIQTTWAFIKPYWGKKLEKRQLSKVHLIIFDFKYVESDERTKQE